MGNGGKTVSVTERLLNVMEAVPCLKKDGKNQAQNYNYLSEESVVTELHNAFTKAGLTMRPLAVDILSEYEYATKNGSARGRILRVTYELADVDGGTLIVQAVGEAADSGDKACAKAMSVAFKYALRQACMISTGDDPDAHNAPEATGKAERIADKLAPKCDDCGEPVVPATIRGITYTVAQLTALSKKKHDANICAACMGKRAEAQATKATSEAASV